MIMLDPHYSDRRDRAYRLKLQKRELELKAELQDVSETIERLNKQIRARQTAEHLTEPMRSPS